ncbi:MAG: hypothetical protein GY756_13890 [bacterium]|nr:hypothetical protein [bacterium]
MKCLLILYFFTYPIFGENPNEAKLMEYSSYKFNIPTSLDDVVNELGEPAYIYERPIMNRHNKRTDKLYILYYDDIALSIYYATELNRYLVSYLSVVNDRYLGKFGISVGSSTDDILKEFGSPSKMGDNFIIYYYGSEGSSVNFYFENGIVEKIYLHMSF